MLYPGKVIAHDIADGRAVCRCERGSLVFTIYGPGIVHVAYFPGEPRALPMWGIRAQPDAHSVWTAGGANDTLTLRCESVTVGVRRSDAAFTLSDSSGIDLPICSQLGLEPAEVAGEATYHLHARFAAPDDERYYGLGQHQLDWMDQRGQDVRLWHDYKAEGGEIIAVPFLVTSRGYGIVWDNPSRSRVRPGGDGQTVWWAEVGEAVSFFAILGKRADDIYAGYRTLTGAPSLPPLAALGYIQCKQRYKSRDDLMRVARTYREKGYPCDILVVDWFHWKVLGDLDLNPEPWPDPAGMNRELADMGYQVMISCWPRFMKESQHYAELDRNGWFMRDREGQTLYGVPTDQRGALIDTTNPDAAEWYWKAIRESYAARGFTSWWLDENEPDICPHPFVLHAGTGARVHNLYPLTHTAAVYDGHRRDLKTRPLILSRSAYHGAQCNGTTFWSSDISPTWDTFRRQIPAGLNFCASGMPYWSSDIGGWQPLKDRPPADTSYQSLLLETNEALKVCPNHRDYPELYVRWFQYGAFCPTFRAHGTRAENEVWSFGERAERIMVSFLRLRYRLLPYIYSLAYRASRTGAPFMRALFMDFPDDPAVADVKDQYMFGPAFLVAPVTEPQATERDVVLPAGADWIDFWSRERWAGGQVVRVAAPLDRIPLFVRAGSIVPMGEDIPHTGVRQQHIRLQVYEGADADFELYRDDGLSLAHENGEFTRTHIRWDDGVGVVTISDDPHGLFAGPQSDWLDRI